MPHTTCDTRRATHDVRHTTCDCSKLLPVLSPSSYNLLDPLKSFHPTSNSRAHSSLLQACKFCLVTQFFLPPVCLYSSSNSSTILPNRWLPVLNNRNQKVLIRNPASTAGVVRHILLQLASGYFQQAGSASIRETCHRAITQSNLSARGLRKITPESFCLWGGVIGSRNRARCSLLEPVIVKCHCLLMRWASKTSLMGRKRTIASRSSTVLNTTSDGETSIGRRFGMFGYGC